MATNYLVDGHWWRYVSAVCCK